jgi:hypothetical protein
MTVVDGSWVPPEPGWVCPECGFAVDDHPPNGMAETVRGFARRYRAPLTRGLPGEDLDALLRTRPAGGGWSALEYACHARDVFLVSDHRIGKVMSERPTFRRVDPDTAATELDYNGQDPTRVVDEIAAATEALATRLETLPPEGWDRVGVREDVEVTVTTIAINAVHEGSHHLLDLARTLRAARGR